MQRILLRSSIYSRSVTLKLMGLDNLYPSVALFFQAIGFKHIVNSLGFSASPWGNPLLNLIGSEVSFPFLVTTITLVFQLPQSLAMTLYNQTGNLCNNITPFNQPWSTESYAFLTSIHAILRLIIDIIEHLLPVRTVFPSVRVPRTIVLFIFSQCLSHACIHPTSIYFELPIDRTRLLLLFLSNKALLQLPK